MSSLPRRVLRDVRVLVTTPVALFVALVFVAGAASAVEFFPTDAAGQQAAQAPQPALSQDQRSEFERWWDAQERVDVPFASDGAKVLVVKFNDYQCPPCRQTYFAYEPILAKYRDRPQDLKYMLRHFPLDPRCNSGVPQLVHPAACDAAAAAVMAGPKGSFDKLTDWFFVHQDELSPATVRQAAKEVGGITDFDAGYEKALQEVKTEASVGSVLGVTSTPTFFINGRRLKGGLPPQYLEAAIELELKRAAK
jgi:protein-disulfide isomerase